MTDNNNYRYGVRGISEAGVKTLLTIIRDAKEPITVDEVNDKTSYSKTTVYYGIKKLTSRGCIINKPIYLDPKHPNLMAFVPSNHKDCEHCQ